MTIWFANTKHAPPICLADLIDRTHLLDKINAVRHRRLLVVQAPAGYGKTTLLAQWRRYASESGARVAWITFEKADVAEVRFVASLASALANAGLTSSDAFAQTERTLDTDTTLNSLFAQADNAARATWLILDDWHLVQNDRTTELLESMLRNLPSNWHIALSSRMRPQLNLVILRARGQIVEIDKGDLCFSAEETLALMGSPDLLDEAIAELTEVTEGWAIALQLARIWRDKNRDVTALKTSFVDAIDGMNDYLASEVFNELSSELQLFLLETSVCTRFNAEVTNSIREQDDSATYLETLNSLYGLIVPLPGHRHWYRHHPIFAEFLASERRKLNPDRIKQLHICAADWFEQHGLFNEAVENSRQSGDQARTIRLVESIGCVDLCIRAGAPAVQSLLDSLPSGVIAQRPRLRAAHAAVNLKHGSIAEAEFALGELQGTLNAGNMDVALARDLLVVENLRLCFIDRNPTLEELSACQQQLEEYLTDDWWLSGLMHNVQGRLAMRCGRLDDAVQSLERAYRIFDAGDSSQGRFFMSVNLAICHLFMGNLDLANDALLQTRKVLELQLDGAPAYAAIANVADALLLYERNELVAASDAANLALDGLEQAEGCFEQYLIAIHVGASVAFSLSGIDAATKVIGRGRRLAQYHGLQRLERILDYLSARHSLDANQSKAPANLAIIPQVNTADSPEDGWIELDFATPVLCLSAISKGRYDEAKSLATNMIDRSRTGNRIPAEIRAQLLMARASAGANTPADTNQALRTALDLATAEGIIQPFFEADGKLHHLLREFHQMHLTHLPAPQSNFLSDLILRIVATEKAKNHTESLTSRECEILGHLTQGGSNKVIARALDLTENAVKFHLKNIFRKLGVGSREMAAAVAERMALEQ